jgi:hypothetical protein
MLLHGRNQTKLSHFTLEQQIEIFAALGFTPKLYTPITNVLRKDTRPNCQLIVRNNEVHLQDFGSDLFGNCFTVYSKYKGISLEEAKQELTTNIISKLPEKKDTTIIISKDIYIHGASIHYNQGNNDFSYFHDFKITQATLDKFNVKTASQVKVVGKTTSYYKATKTAPCFIYTYSSGLTLYRPLSNKTDKWRMTHTEIQGLAQIDKEKHYPIFVITKSLKDVMVLYELGIPSIAPPSENIPLDLSKIKDLNVDKYILLFDNDVPGKEATQLFVDKWTLPTPLQVAFVPYPDKDISDFSKNHTFNETKQLVIELTTYECTC